MDCSTTELYPLCGEQYIAIASFIQYHKLFETVQYRVPVNWETEKNEKKRKETERKKTKRKQGEK